MPWCTLYRYLGICRVVSSRYPLKMNLMLFIHRDLEHGGRLHPCACSYHWLLRSLQGPRSHCCSPSKINILIVHREMSMLDLEAWSSWSASCNQSCFLAAAGRARHSTSTSTVRVAVTRCYRQRLPADSILTYITSIFEMCQCSPNKTFHRLSHQQSQHLRKTAIANL